MNMLKIRCPHCKQEFYVDKDLSEQIVECQNCQQKIRVPKMDKATWKSSDIVIDSASTECRIDLIAAIRELQGWGLKEAITFVDHLLLTFMENIPTNKAKDVKRRLEKTGAVIHLEPYNTTDTHIAMDQNDVQTSQTYSNSQHGQQKCNESRGTNSSSFLFVCPECGTASELKGTMKGKSYICPACGEKVTANPSETRRCPHCGGEIKIKAVLCKYCHKDVPSLNIRSSEKKNTQSNSYPSDTKKQNSNSNNVADTLGFIVLFLVVLGVIALILWLLWSFVTGMPRLAFWLIVSIFWIIYMACGGLKKKSIALILLIGTIAWGWWAHTHFESQDAREARKLQEENEKLMNETIRLEKENGMYYPF